MLDNDQKPRRVDTTYTFFAVTPSWLPHLGFLGPVLVLEDIEPASPLPPDVAAHPSLLLLLPGNATEQFKNFAETCLRGE